MEQNTTDSIRINKELLDKIRTIAKSRGQTISGFVNINLNKVVDRAWHKIEIKKDEGKKSNL
jgi:antitoxin component of RelBE/YafQ-DinJ toxin-antitoxin module